MSAPQVVKAVSLQDVVALVPFECGFHPRHSVVLLSLRGRRLRVGQVARVDLPAPEDVPDLVAELVWSVVRDRGSASIVAVYDDLPWDAQAPPHVELVTELLRALEVAGARARDAVYVSPERYWSYLCRGRGCCPPDGEAVDAAMGSPVAAALVLAGVAPLPTREDLAARLRPSRPLVVAAVTDRAWGWLATLSAEVQASDGPAGSVDDELRAVEQRWIAAAGGLLDRLLPRYRAGEPAMADDEAGQLVAYLQSVPVRDDLLLRYCRLGVPVPEGTAQPPAGGQLLPGLGGPTPPDVEREEAMGRLLVDLCSRVEGPLAAAALCLLGWHSWARGEGALARIAVDRALAEDPTYRLAALLTSVLDHGLAPDWVGAARQADEAAS